MSDQNKHPIASVGIYVENDKGELLLVNTHKFDGKYAVPAGKIKYGETAEQAVERELFEEVGLRAKRIEFLKVIDMIQDPEFVYDTQAHFVGSQYHVRVSNSDVQLNDEAQEYEWVSPKEIVKRNDVAQVVLDCVSQYFIGKTKKKTDKHNKALETEMLEYKAGWQRAQADYQNLVREMDSKKSELMAWSKQMIIEDFIPVYDNFKKAFLADRGKGEEGNENWVKGIEFIMKQYGKVLEDHGVVEMKTVGETFDPAKHEAISEEDSDEEEGTILRELDPGYMMGEKVIKAAKVVVAKNSKS